MTTLLRSERSRRGLRATDLAREIGVHPMSILRWERRERLPGPAHIHALARALELEPAHVAGFFHDARSAGRRGRAGAPRPGPAGAAVALLRVGGVPRRPGRRPGLDRLQLGSRTRAGPRGPHSPAGPRAAAGRGRARRTPRGTHCRPRPSPPTGQPPAPSAPPRAAEPGSGRRRSRGRPALPRLLGARRRYAASRGDPSPRRGLRRPGGPRRPGRRSRAAAPARPGAMAPGRPARRDPDPPRVGRPHPGRAGRPVRLRARPPSGRGSPLASYPVGGWWRGSRSRSGCRRALSTLPSERSNRHTSVEKPPHFGGSSHFAGDQASEENSQAMRLR